MRHLLAHTMIHVCVKFIVGKDIAMLKVDVLSARICNINDEVIKWNVGSESKLNSQQSQQF